MIVDIAYLMMFYIVIGAALAVGADIGRLESEDPDSYRYDLFWTSLVWPFCLYMYIKFLYFYDEDDYDDE